MSTAIVRIGARVKVGICSDTSVHPLLVGIVLFCSAVGRRQLIELGGPLALLIGAFVNRVRLCDQRSLLVIVLLQSCLA